MSVGKHVYFILHCVELSFQTEHHYNTVYIEIGLCFKLVIWL